MLSNAPLLAHSASDAYMDLTVDPAAGTEGLLLHGQWDIALRDLDFVLNLDANGDGQLTWDEVRRRQGAIEKYAYAQLHFTGGPCTLVPTRQLIDDHADGAYAALFFDVRCVRSKSVMLSYQLFFAIDPSHRGIFVMHSAANASTALLSPNNSRISLNP